MGKILRKHTTNLSKEYQKELSAIFKERLKDIENFSFVSRKITETYTFNSEDAKNTLIRLKEKDGFSLISENENTLIFEK